LPAWLGVALAASFGLVAAHRAVLRDLPAALMAAGMAVMSLGMAGVGLGLVHGPWWAAGFASVAVWPLVRGVPVCGGRLAHLLGGVAMVYMCALPGHQVGAGAGSPAGGGGLATLAGHHGHGGAEVTVPGGASAGLVGPGGGALALLGWALACYFLLGTVSALTRRDAAGVFTSPRPTVLVEAAMALGTAVMLAALS
jgi:Domain of unknown function (DUF5134)